MTMDLKQTFVIKSHTDQLRVQDCLSRNREEALENKTPLIVKISTKQEDRSTAQNRLYWKWLNEWSRHIGSDKDSEHFYFKKKFLIGIYNRDDVEFAEMCQAIKQLKKNEKEEYEAIAQHVIRMTSTTKATVAQMSEYLNNIHDFCLVQGKYLEAPDDLKWVVED